MEADLSSCWDNSISSAESYPYNATEDPRVMLFDNPNLSIGCGAGSFKIGNYSY